MAPEKGDVRSFLSSADAPPPDPVVEALACGRAEGRAEGRSEALAEIEAARAVEARSIGRSLRHLTEVEGELVARRESVLLEIALEAAARIVRERIDAGDEVALRAMRDAMEALPASTSLRVRLHPTDIEMLSTELQSDVARGRIELVWDPTITRGGCIVESTVGTVDATIEAAFDAVRAAAAGTAVTP
jgi:flagellar assembly protein FliH